MSGIETIVEFGCLSDEQRWHARRFDWKWLSELDDHDRKMVDLLDCLADGEFSGQASAAQFFELMVREMDAGYPKELAYDWGELFAYVHIIAYEELRHGLSLGLANHFVKNGNLDFISGIPVREFGKKYVWCYEERKYWDIYAYVLAHLFGEVVNTELYRDMRIQIHHPELKQVVTNIMTDEARHTRAWAEMIKNLVRADPRHETRALASLERGLTHHNAMVHETYFEGQNKMMGIFLPARGAKKAAIDRIVDKKVALLVEIFADKNPYTTEDVKDIHMRFLQRALGEKRAVYSPEAEGGIQFVKDA
jgi:hypothetical protein